MASGTQSAAGGHWMAAAPPNLRDRAVQKMLKSLPQVHQVNDPQGIVSQYEDKLFSQSHNLEDYLRTVSMKVMSAQQKWQPVVQPASDHQQQQAHMGQQMRPLNAVLSNSAAAAMPGTASTIPLIVRPPQVQDMHNQANPSNFPPVASVVPQVHPRQPVVTQKKRQFGHPEVHNSQQFGHPAEEVDWREDMFQKITSLKDAHLSELMEFGRALRARVPQGKTNEQLDSLPKEQADQYRGVVNIMARITCVSSFLQLQKSNIPERAKDQFGRFQTNLYGLLHLYRESKASNARKNVGRQSQNCHELPRVNGTKDNNRQNHPEQPAAEAFPQSSQNVPTTSPLAQQQNPSDHLADEAENDEVLPEAETEASTAVNLPDVTGDTAPFRGGACNQEIRQESRPTEEAIPPLTQKVDPAETSPAQQQTSSTVPVEEEDDSVLAKAETPVRKPLSPAALRSLASDMGVNMKRVFRHTTPGTMDGSGRVWFDDQPSEGSCYKRPKTHGGSLLDEIRAAHDMLVATKISISEDGTGGADGTVIDLCYNAVSLASDLRAAIGASEMSTKLLVPADYPRSSPVILGGDGEQRNIVPVVVDVAFQRALVLLPKPRSIEGMATAWDSVVQRAVMLFVHRLGGGTFSMRYGCGESCIPV